MAVPLDVSLPAAEMCDLIDRADATVFVADEVRADVIAAAKESCPKLKYIISMQKEESSPEVLSFWQLVNGQEPGFLCEVQPDDLATIMFTSGTTGKSKGVMLTHRNMAENATCLDMKFEEHSVLLSVLPIHHAYCLSMDILKGLSTGAVICINDSLIRMAKNIRLFKPNIILMVPLMISNMAAGNVSIQLGFKGKCTNVVTACATGTNCIGDALRAIQYGDADIIAAGGTESCICPTGVAGFTSLTALSASTDPLRASIPFDKDRDGFVLGEGAGVVILEELEHAKARGAKIYAELVGYGATGDAYHITSPAEDGSGAAKAMELAMEEGGIEPSQVDYINAHGTSTHHNDLFETRAIKLALGDAAKDVVVNSTKSMIGHLLGAAGGVEFIACVKTIQDGFIHQTMGTREADEECDLNYAIGAPVEKDVNYVLTNSLGFGGHNATLLLKKYEG